MVAKKTIKKKIEKKRTPQKETKVVRSTIKAKLKSKIKKVIIKKTLTKKTKKVLKSKKEVGIKLERSSKNPIISPTMYSWESQAAFNPAAIISGGRVHLFYRALGDDGVSRIGYASSKDGINFDTRLSYPVYIAQNFEEAQKHWPFTSPARLTYNPSLYSSGGGWGGCEDPRAVIIDGQVYMTFNMFNGWNSMRVAVTSIKEENLLNGKWIWNNFSYLSRPGDRQKNWVLFPEKINGKFAIFHNLDKGDPNQVHIAYVNKLTMLETPSPKDAPDPQALPDHDVAWHYRTRSAACPPIKTKEGWLLLYHAMDRSESHRYKLGALILDLKKPEKVIYRSNEPILEPDEWYENNSKPGIIYANGAIIKDGNLMVYYGGGDKYIGVASINLEEFLKGLKEDKVVKLKTNKGIIK